MNICVYGASSNQIENKYIELTEEFGRQLAMRGHSLVFGGGANGIMGAAARGCHEGNGKIIGVSPKFFDIEGVLFKECTKLIYTETMRERKQIMEDNSDGFVMMPGGIGTYEEFFEILTAKQLGRHKKPIVVFNMFGFYDAMDEMIESAIVKKFIFPSVRDLYKTFENSDEILDYLEHYEGNLVDLKEMKGL
ncbi:MAG: TIGR00730 family Rossman fold protein [Clostridia bacterium]|nr:TIGR00730 family Rossman fold protein [Clostridia bacterium]